MNIVRTKHGIWFGVLLLNFVGSLHSHFLNSAIDPIVQGKIDDFVKNVYLPASQISGMGLAVTQNNGDILYTAGFGEANIEKGILNGNTTQFLIGSITKSFTASIAVKILSEKFPDLGEAVLDTPIRKLVPGFNFTLIDRFRSEYATFRDLLSHRMCLFNDDLQLSAEPFNTTEEIVYRTRYAPQECGIRAGFVYNNQMFMLAGQLIATIANQSYESLGKDLLLSIGMHNSTFSLKSDDFANMAYRAQPYYVRNITSFPMNPELVKTISLGNPAGGLFVPPNDMAKYMDFQLNFGKVENKQIIEEEVMKWLTKPANNLPVLNYKSEENELIVNVFGYGLGLGIGAYDGWQYVQHSGYFPPYQSLMSLFPASKIGILTSTNEGPVLVDPLVLHSFIFETLRGNNKALEKATSLMAQLTAKAKAEKIRQENYVVELIRSGRRKQSMADNIIGKYGSGGSGDLEIFEKFNIETNSTGIYLTYGKWAQGWLENIGGTTYELTWDSDLVQGNYAAGDYSGVNYAQISNGTVEFLLPSMDGLVPVGRFEIGVSLETLPIVPWSPGSCGLD